MGSVDMNLLKKLRDTSFAPLKDCKEALVAVDGDFDAALEWLKKKGAANAAKKADRETHEGVVKVVKEGDKVIGIKIACETDFVAKNDLFIQLTNDLLNAVKAYGKDFASIEEADESAKAQWESMLHEFVGKIGENVKLVDAFISTGNAFVYSHPGDKIVAVLYYNGTNASETNAKNIALQIAAMNPEYLSMEDVPADIVEAAKAKISSELADSGKPADILEKIVAGRLDKEFSDNVLLEQSAIWDDSKKVKEFVNGLEITSFKRFSI